MPKLGKFASGDGFDHFDTDADAGLHFTIKRNIAARFARAGQRPARN